MQSQAEINKVLLKVESEFTRADNDGGEVGTWEIVMNTLKKTIAIRIYQTRYVLSVDSAEMWPEGSERNAPDAMRDIIAEMMGVFILTIRAVTMDHEDPEYLRFHFGSLLDPGVETIYAFKVVEATVEVVTNQHEENPS